MKVFAILLFSIFVQCQNTPEMEEKSSNINLEIIYEESKDSIPALLKEITKEKRGLETSKIEIANPEVSFPRTYLELYGSSTRLLGRFASENGLHDARFFSLLNDGLKYAGDGLENVDLALTENGKLWKLTSEYVSLSNPKDSSEIKHPLVGVKLHELGDGSAWVVGLRQAWFISDRLEEAQNFPWQGGIRTVVMNENLYSFNKTNDTIISMDKHGVTKTLKVNAAHSPFENLVGYWKDSYMTVENSAFRVYNSSGLLRELLVQSIGVLENGDPYISYTKNNSTFLISNSLVREWKLPADYSNFILPIVCNKGDTYLGYHLGVYSEFNSRTGDTGPINDINDAGYEKLIEPYRWKRGSNRFYSIINSGNIVVSVTGPNGIVLININMSE